MQTLCYLTFTEAVSLCKSRVHEQVAEEVRGGSIAYRLTRPCSYVLYRAAAAMGEASVKTLPVLVVGAVTAPALAGPLPG